MAEIVSVYIASEEKGEPCSQSEAILEAGFGIVGDRYYRRAHEHPEKHAPSQEVTLIEEEQVLSYNRGAGHSFAPADFRRNVITRGIDLNALEGRTFRLGACLLEGLELCEPCSYLAKMLDRPVHKEMVGRSGLRARILEGGVIRPGDRIEAA